MRKIGLPISKEKVSSLSRGDKVLLTGFLYTARDEAHKRMVATLRKGEKLPMSLLKETIYYMGLSPTPPGKIIGACGPTTSKRMDPYMGQLLEMGLLVTIGKGERSEDVVRLIAKYGAIYFVTFGGAGAYLSQRVKSKELVAYEDLGPEAIYRLYVEDFPAIVAIDSYGRTIFR